MALYSGSNLLGIQTRVLRAGSANVDALYQGPNQLWRYAPSFSGGLSVPSPGSSQIAAQSFVSSSTTINPGYPWTISISTSEMKARFNTRQNAQLCNITVVLGGSTIATSSTGDEFQGGPTQGYAVLAPFSTSSSRTGSQQLEIRLNVFNQTSGWAADWETSGSLSYTVTAT